MRYPYTQRNLLPTTIMSIDFEQDVVTHSSGGHIRYRRTVASHMSITIVTVYIPRKGNIVWCSSLFLCNEFDSLTLAYIELLDSETVFSTIVDTLLNIALLNNINIIAQPIYCIKNQSILRCLWNKCSRSIASTTIIGSGIPMQEETCTARRNIACNKDWIASYANTALDITRNAIQTIF